MFGSKKIIKTINIEGLSCMHCAKKVENALKEVKGVKSVKVVLEEKKAEIVLKEDVDDRVLREKIEELGYKVVE